MDKTAIKNFAMQARNMLRAMAEKEAGFYGVTRTGCANPVQKGMNFETYKTPAGTDNTIYGADIRRRASLKKAVEELGFEQVIEETAYTWFNRIIAIRFMEVNDYLPTRVRVLSSENGGLTPDIVTHSLDVELNLTVEEHEKIQKAKDANDYDEAYRILFIKQCNELNDILPGLFERTDDYMELLLKVSYTGDSVIRLLVDGVAEDNFNVETEGQVEIIGWMYQYYNSELKDDTFAKLKDNIKISKERIPAVTQLFTPDWIVRYMVENSVGRVWIDHLRALDERVDEKAKAEEYGWKYYLPEAEQEAEVTSQLVEIRKSYKDIMPQDITCIDPCMGSGHILVYMFDVLMDIYKSEGYSERDAVFEILQKNIFGLDIDRRAYQLSYFALMMKGRRYAGRRFFRGKEDENGECIPVTPHIYAIEESNAISKDQLKYFGAGLDELSKNNAITQMNGLLDTLTNAKEYGSILNVENYDWKLLSSFVAQTDTYGQMTFNSMGAVASQKMMARFVEIGKVLAQKYFIVVTNPPYMNLGSGNNKINAYAKRYYPNSKTDLFAIFIERCSKFCEDDGYFSMITQHSWMFLSSYEKLRFILRQASLVNMAHLGARAFDEISGEVVQTSAFVYKKTRISSYSSVFVRLINAKSELLKKEAFQSGTNRYVFKQEDFVNIPGAILGYWISQTTYNVFITSKESMAVYANAEGKNITTDNSKYIRCFWETPFSDTGKLGKKWLLCAMGGSRRKWFGNIVNVIDWSAESRDYYKKASAGRIIREEFWGLSGVTWGKIGTGKPSFRILPQDYMYQETAILQNSMDDSLFALAVLNAVTSDYFLQFLSPTMNFQQQDINAIPLPMGYKAKKSEIINIVTKLIEQSKADWDSFELSFDFEQQPLVRLMTDYYDTAIQHIYSKHNLNECSDVSCNVEKCFLLWQGECDKRIKIIKENEEEINRIFIDLYGLQTELKPDVEDKDITVYKADLGKDIRALISYAVGCMFGRYSLAKPGLVYAGGKFDDSQYGNFPADDDAIIPITDEAYFNDDIVGRFEEFLKVVYGADSLEANLKYIADALGTKGATSREKIRNYFLNDFFKDHCNTYSVTGSGKRPIYWLFDSGKQNGFKALIYMHRYTPDTVGLVRSVYLKKVSDAIEASLKNAEYIILENASAVDVAQATKKRDKYVKQLAEIKPYYQALSHVAMQRIPLNLDDGVKANYAKFQGIEVAEDGGMRQTIDLLAKI